MTLTAGESLEYLLQHLETNIPEFEMTGRRLVMWTEISTKNALFIRHTGDDDEWQGDLQVTTVRAELWVYSRSGEDPNVAPDVDLNDLVQKVRCALEPDDRDSNLFTMGGRVYSCRIEGRSDFDPGDIDKWGKAVLPVKIVLP